MKTRIRQLTEQEKRSLGESQMLSDWMKDFPNGILSVVSDTFDLWKLITEYLPDLKEQIMSRNGKLVIRPDSGNPVDIICGTSSTIMHLNITRDGNPVPFDNAVDYELRDFDNWYDNPIWGETNGKNPDLLEFRGRYFVYGKEGYHKTLLKSYKEVKWDENIDKGVIELLWDIFGGTINKQGYKVLDPHIGAIYGDSITLERQEAIFERLAAKGFASTNIVLGIGSFTYQYNTRDTFGFAAKGAWFEVETNEIEKCHFDFTSRCTMDRCDCPKVKKSYNIYKDPVTDNGTKKSLKGLQAVFQTENPHVEENGEIWVKSECTPEEENQGLLQVIYEDGEFYNQTTLTEIRKRLNDLI